MRRSRYEPLHVREAREELEREKKEAEEFLNRHRVSGARVLRCVNEPPSPELEPVEVVMARFEQERDLVMEKEIAEFLDFLAREEREIAIIDGKIPVDASDEEVRRVQNKRPLGALRPSDEPRSVRSSPALLPWKRKLHP